MEKWWRDCSQECIPALLLKGNSEGPGGSGMPSRTPGLGKLAKKRQIGEVS